MKRRCLVTAPVVYAPTRATSTGQSFEDLFQTFVGRDFFRPAQPERQQLPMCTWEDDNSVIVELDLPGIKQEDVEIEVHNKVLAIQAKRTAPVREGGWDNRSYGEFAQKLRLPDTVNESEIEAKLANGVLLVRLPKVEQPKPRKVTINSDN